MNLKLNQIGRSMIEMLAVLLVIGVLTVGLIVGLDDVVAGYKSSQISKDVLVGVSHISSRRHFPSQPANLRLKTSSGKSMQYYADDNKLLYVVLKNVEEDVCKELLNMNAKGLNAILNSEKETMTETLCEAAATQDMHFQFNLKSNVKNDTQGGGGG